MKFRKITRAASEFMILSIIMEKGESHPYEIYQTLIERVAGKQKPPVRNLELLIKYSSMIMDFFDNEETDGNQEKKIISLINSIESPFSKKLLLEFLEQGKKDVKLQANLKDLIKDARIITQKDKSDLEAWQKPPAIYQVLKSLEKRKLIKFSRTEQYQGKSRNLYTITEKGIPEAFTMLTTLGDLNQLIIPMARFFRNHINLQMQNHLTIVFRIMKQLYPNKNLSDIFEDPELIDPNFILELSSLFPIIDNDSLFIPILFDDTISTDAINAMKVIPEQQVLFKEIVLKKLRSYKEKINKVIKEIDQDYLDKQEI